MRIFYVCPDVAEPSGGIKRLYTHVELLRENGYDAYIMHVKKGFKLHWFDSQAPIVYPEDSPLSSFDSKDTFVIPEGHPLVMKQFKTLPVKKVVIALNPAHVFQSMPVGENWKNYGINWVMANNKTIKDFIQWSMGIKNIHVIESSVDHSMFYYKPDMKNRQVAYIKKKDTLTPLVENILKSKDASFHELAITAIENLNIQDYAQVLRESKIYLTTSAFEGFPRSIIEAMACGCICIGFHGIGGKDYIIESGRQQNFVLAESMNFIDLSKKLAELVEMIKHKDPRVGVIRQNALATAAGFSPESEKKSILEFWRTFFETES